MFDIFKDPPSEDVVIKLKAKFPNRSLHSVEIDVSGETFYFLMTGPTKVEFKKYHEELKAAGSDGVKLIQAVETAALAQLRWPEREDIQALFEHYPGLPTHFGEYIGEFAGVNADSRAKKL